ncbi:MAG: type II secretion system F family protein [Ktedonobacterales bacterium]|nr:type II secretion system F family protein [Ktedonobacterales bacterium]
MISGIAWLAALATGLSIFLMVAGFALSKRRDAVNQRLDRLLQQQRAHIDEDLRRPLLERLLRPILGQLSQVVGRFAPSKSITKIQAVIERADLAQSFDGSTFMTLRVFAGAGFALTLGALALLMHTGLVQSTLFALAGGGAAFIMPALWLNGKAKARQNAIRSALPDMVDMLTLCTGAMPFERALERVALTTVAALRFEIQHILIEIRAGKKIGEALELFAQRVAIEDLTLLVATLNQGQQLGTPIEQILHDQSNDMRVKRRQRAEKLAREAPVKMMFPLVLLVFPPIFIVLLGPSIPQILHSIAPGMHL